MSNEKTESNLEFTAADESRQFLGGQLKEKQQLLMQLTPNTPDLERADLQAETAEIMLEVSDAGMVEAAWGYAKESFLIYIENEQWEKAVHAADILYRTELPAAVTALGNGLWLAVAYPIDPELSIVMLNNFIEDTPASSDGAAVAAAVAHYIADLRYEGEKRDSTMFLTSSLLAKIAERHSQVSSQSEMNGWMLRLELNDSAAFLPRMSQILDAIVDDNWWYDKDKLRKKIPS
ncbi:MAG: hypothetical protein KAH22_03580 [Thiotrichaceae bacterium]|nr:hypothetical protein [Thiotrichaceae bacterium]